MAPLSPGLYRRLEQRFGRVKRIANEGNKAVVYVVISAITGKPVTRFSDPGEQYVVCCPFCGDTNGHLYVSYLYGTDDPVSMTPRDSLVRCWRRDCMKEHEHREQLRNALYGMGSLPRHAAIQYGRPGPVTLTEVHLPGRVLPLTSLESHNSVLRYLHDQRGFDIQELTDVWRVGYCTEPSYPRDMAGRIFIPVTQDGHLVGWQGRYPADIDWKAAQIPKYYNLPGVWRGRMLYNVDRATQENVVVMVEGAMSAWPVGPAAVALLGKTINDTQVSLLMSRLHAAKRLADAVVVLMLDSPGKDPDAPRAAQAVMQRLRQRIPNVINIELPGAIDPGDCSRHRRLLWNYIASSLADAGLSVPLPAYLEGTP